MTTLIGDIGGTQARFALAEGGAFGAVVTLRVAGHATPLAALRVALAELGPADGAILAIAGPIEQVAEHVGAALCGTFMGVLFAYGFLSPLSTGIQHVNSAEARYYSFLKSAIVAFAKGFSPIVAAEFARRSIFTEDRPSFAEMEEAVKKKAA